MKSKFTPPYNIEKDEPIPYFNPSLCFFIFIMASLNYFKRLSKEEKDFVKNYIYDLLMKKSPEEIYNKYKPSEDLFNKCKEVFSPSEYHDLCCIKTEFLDKLDQNPDPKDEEAQIFFSSQI